MSTTATDPATQAQQSTQPNPSPQLPATTAPKAPVLIGDNGLRLGDLDALWRFSSIVSASGLAPKGIMTKEAIFVAVQMGLEVGLTPMAALQNIAVINGRPAIWGDAQLAIVRGTGQLEVLEEWFESAGKRLPRNPVNYTDDTVAVCRVKRRGHEASEVGFSVADAKTAKLWGKEGPWSQYPFRMLKFRARSFALRDQFGDALKGIMSAEEAGDIIEVTATTAPVKSVEIAKPSFLNPATTVTATQVEAVKEAKTAAEPEGEGVLQNRLAAFCAGEGASFDVFMGTLGTLGWLGGNDQNATSFLDLSNALCQRMLKAPAGLKKALEAAKGGAK